MFWRNFRHWLCILSRLCILSAWAFIDKQVQGNLTWAAWWGCDDDDYLDNDDDDDDNYNDGDGENNDDDDGENDDGDDGDNDDDDGGENDDDENEQSEKISTCRLRGFALCSDLPALWIQYEWLSSSPSSS